MAYTDKQVRNGATGSGGEQNSAQPGPMPDLSGMKIASETAAIGRTNQAQDIFQSPAGSGPSPASTVEAAERQIGAAGNMWEWDSGLQVDELSGEA